MIRSFRDKDTEALYEGRNVGRFQSFQKQAERRMQILVMYATFVLDQIDWFKTGTTGSPANYEHKASPYLPAEAHQYFSSSIIFQSNWGYSSRQLTLQAVIELDPPAGNGRLPTVDGGVRELLSSLGRIRNTRILAVASPEETKILEESARHANDVVVACQGSLDSILSRLSLPHVLADPPSICGSMDNVSAKKPLTRIFKGTGYRYLHDLGGQGVYFLGKRTRRNNEILLVFDLAPIARAFSWGLQIHGPLWSHMLHMKFYPNTHKQYAITGQETLDKLVENAKEIAVAFEDTVLSDIEGIYGAAPAWYVYRE